MDKVGGVLFGKSGYDQQETLSPEQLMARNAQSQAMRQGVVNSGQALAGYTQAGFNPYDEVDGAGQFGRMQNFLGEDQIRQQSALKGGPMNRFSTASAKMSGDISNNYQRNMLGVDQARLQAQTQGRQQGYGNQMQAIQQALAGNQGTLQNSNQIQNTQGMGLTQLAGGIGGIASMAGKLFGGR